MQLAAHFLGVVHGLAAAVISLAVFYVAGVLLTPRRWQNWMRWPDALVAGLLFYVVFCWIAVSSRNIPLKYVTLIFAGSIWALASIRPAWLRSVLATRVPGPPARRWLVDFSALYVLAYVLMPPAAGSAVLPLGPGNNISLVTYARYARQVLDFGTANIDLAAFDYLHSPASIYLIAWQSLMFGRDPLQAAMPTLFLQASLFGMLAAETARTAFGLSHRLSMAIAVVVACGPLFRWALGTYALAEVMSASALLYVLRILVRTAANRTVAAPVVPTAIAGATLLVFAAPPWSGWGSRLLSGIAGLLSTVPLVSLFGVPGNVSLAADLSVSSRSAAVLVLAIVPLLLAGAVLAARGWHVLERPQVSDTDRRLARALIVYAGVALVLGNVTVQAVRRPEAVRRPAAWRQLHDVSDQSFRALTVKVVGEADGLATALAMYYLPGRKAQVFGRGISPQELSFESVSKQQPMFIQNFGCEGVGHRDAVFVREVGCLLMAPPSMTLDTSYPFNQTFLFVTYDRMTARDPGGRWNTRPTLHLRVTVDPQRTPLDRELFINLLVNPFLPEGVKPQRLVVKWGSGQSGETLIGERGWFSLPVRSGDWKGNRVWALPITIDFLDGRTILFHEIALTESPRGTVVSQY